MTPPPPSRHRGVLTFKESVSLFDLRNSASQAEDCPMNHSFVMKVESVVTYQCFKNDSDARFLKMELNFWSSRADPGGRDDVEQMLPFPCVVTMPSHWTPSVYLRALYHSVTQSKVICISSVKIDRSMHTSLNELDWFFKLSKVRMNEKMLSSDVYHRVIGGELL